MPVKIHSVQLSDGSARVRRSFSAADAVTVEIEWDLGERLYKPRIGFILYTTDGFPVFTALDAQSWAQEYLEPGQYLSSCQIPAHFLNEDTYTLCLSGDVPRRFDFKLGLTGSVADFEVEDDMTLPNKYYGDEGFRDARWPGVTLPKIPWTQKRRNHDGLL
jgi:hypothetical protein